jgi:hypothetical protein
MERIVRHITEKLTAQLPRFREFYTPDDLQVLDIPPFITERVILEMHQNLSESVDPPETEWADMDGESVRFAWKNFLEAIKAEVRMPSSYAAPLLETAVADALELATQPRKAIPEILFGSDTSLSIEKLKKRIRYVTIGRPLAAALIRYMEKKNKNELVIDDCKKIIGQIDEKLISSFNSLDWAKELEPLFVLAGPSVDTDLFRVYFEDKERKKISRVFDRLNKSLNRTEFIEVMSSPEQLLDEDEDMIKTQKPDDDKKVGSKRPAQKEQVDEKGDVESEDAEDSILNSFQKRRGDSLPEEDEEVEISKESDESEEELHTKFRLDQDQEDQENEEENLYKEMNLKKSSSDYRSGNLNLDEEEEDEDPKKLHTDLLSKWKAISGDDNEDEDHEDEDKTTSERESEVEDLAETDRPDDEDDTGVKSIELYNETDDEEDVPIWRAFLEREDLSSVASEEDRRKKKTDRDDKLEMADKLADRFFGSYDEDADESLEATAEALIEFLSDEKNRFISEIFSGSEKAYEESLEDIALLDDWKSASKFIKDEIFNRNHIDIFDEVAVDFTDRLHTFFKERK